MKRYEGGCHCGAIRVSFESEQTPETLPVRACGCSFCRAHGAVTMTDPDGLARIDADRDALNRYQFGLRTADFIVCRNCGAYVGAFFDDGDAAYATLNVNTFRDRARFVQTAAHADYAAEDSDARMARRRLRWTPATLVVTG